MEGKNLITVFFDR